MPLWWNGRHAGLRSQCREACEFESRWGHHIKVYYWVTESVRILYRVTLVDGLGPCRVMKQDACEQQ